MLSADQVQKKNYSRFILQHQVKQSHGQMHLILKKYGELLSIHVQVFSVLMLRQVVC